MNNTAARRQVGLDMTQGSILRLLVTFTLPLLLSNLLQQLYNMVDVAVIGQFVGSVGTVGVSTGGEIATFLTFVATSFGTAGQIYVAQLVGARDEKGVQETIGTLLTFMMLLSLASTAASILWCDPLLKLLNTPPEAMAQARSYMQIVSLGMPAVFGYNAVCGIMRGIGESKRPLLFIAISASANVVLDLFLVAVIPLQAAGTAIATVIAEAAAFLASLLFMYRRQEHFCFHFHLREFAIRRRCMGVLLKLGIPLTLQTAFIHLSQLYCTAQINNFGLVASATNSVGSKLNKLINSFTSSVQGGAGAMIGQNIGAQRYDRVRRTVWATFGFCCVFCAAEVFLALVMPRQMFGIFSRDSAVLDAGVIYMEISVIMFVLATIQAPLMSLITGVGNAPLSFLAGMLDGVILRLGISIYLAQYLHFGVTGYYYGNVLARLGPVAVGAAYYFSGRWMHAKSLVETPAETGGEPAAVRQA